MLLTYLSRSLLFSHQRTVYVCVCVCVCARVCVCVRACVRVNEVLHLQHHNNVCFRFSLVILHLQYGHNVFLTKERCVVILTCVVYCTYTRLYTDHSA